MAPHQCEPVAGFSKEVQLHTDEGSYMLGNPCSEPKTKKQSVNANLGQSIFELNMQKLTLVEKNSKMMAHLENRRLLYLK